MSQRSVTSLQNPAVKAVRALHQRKAREESGLFLAEGLKFVAEAMALGLAPRTLLHGPGASDHPLMKAAIRAAGETLAVSPAILAKISRRDNPQMVLGVFEQVFAALEALDPSSATCWVALEAVRDPGNLGTIVRTADAAGCGAVILVGPCCDPYSVEAVRATMGSIFVLPIVRTSVEDFLRWRKAWPGAVVGATLDGATDLRAAAWRKPVLLLMGNEQTGLSSQMAGTCDATVKIPMRGRADSLNLAVATGVMIYAASG